jgi:hypothetical protein
MAALQHYTQNTPPHTEHFVLCLAITDKCINSHQFFISLSSCYMFCQLCAILREFVRPFWVTCQFGVLVDKNLCSMWLCVYYVAAWCISICLSMLPNTRTRTRPPHSIHTATYYTEFYQPKTQIDMWLRRYRRAPLGCHTVAKTCWSS